MKTIETNTKVIALQEGKVGANIDILDGKFRSVKIYSSQIQFVINDTDDLRAYKSLLDEILRRIDEFI